MIKLGLNLQHKSSKNDETLYAVCFLHKPIETSDEVDDHPRL